LHFGLSHSSGSNFCYVAVKSTAQLAELLEINRDDLVVSLVLSSLEEDL